MAQSLRIDCHARPSELINNAIRIFTTRLEERTGLQAQRSGRTERILSLDVQAHGGREGYRIEDGPASELRVVGHDEQGLLYGLGKLLRNAVLEKGRFEPGPWRGVSVPRREVRGMYFATHFHNFYHDAPLQKVQRYVEDLALWGCNALNVWFDMHHYKSFADPSAQAMVQRLRVILQAAHRVGMGAALGALANEAYAQSPEHMRAVRPVPAHYGVELCPHKPGAAELMLHWRQEMLEAFADVGIDYYWLWPYDQGGCACPHCSPWGAKGFLDISRPMAELVRRLCPRAKIILSTWCFDYPPVTGEWAGLKKELDGKPGWVDYLLADAHGDFPRFPLEKGVPGASPMLNFPEISMYGMTPWGGWGANPLPQRFQRIWESVGGQLAGGFPYSEGIFEDLNKTVNLCHYWDDQDAGQSVREYVAAYFSPKVVEEVAQAVGLMEHSHGHSLTNWNWQVQPWPVLDEQGRACEVTQAIYQCSRIEKAQECLDLMRRADAALPDSVRTSWRWRILLLRAILDLEMVRGGGVPTAASEAAFEELERIYHSDHAELAVAPPSVSGLRRLILGDGGAITAPDHH